MANDRIEQAHEKIGDRVAAAVKCPICGRDTWERMADTILTVLASSHDAFRRANSADDDSPPRDDDHWSVFGVGSVCANCGFLRLHVVDPEGLT